MNKKFFTLIASALMLVASFGTVNAQGVVPAFPDTIDIAAPDGPVQRLALGENDGLYHLHIKNLGTDAYLGIDSEGYLFAFDRANYPLTYGESLWCANVESQDQGQTIKFDFTNKRHGYKLSVGTADRNRIATATTYGDSLINVNRPISNLYGWGFSAMLNPLETDNPLYTYYDTDNVLVFAMDPAQITVPGGRGVVEVVSLPGTDVVRGNYPATVTVGTRTLTVLEFDIARPAPLWLTADMFNTMLNTQPSAPVTLDWMDMVNGSKQEVTLKSDSPWNTGLVADSVPWSKYSSLTPAWHYNFRTGAWSTTAIDESYGLMFHKNGDKSAYLRVDTSYMQTSGQDYLKFVWKDTISSKIIGQYVFYAEYYPSADSLNIYAHEVRQRDILNEPTWFGTEYNSTTPGTSISTWPTWAGGRPVAGEPVMTSVAPQNLEDNTVEITVFNGPAGPTPFQWGWASLGLKGCKEVVRPGLSTVPTDLYTIRNAEGQYLVMPIYTDTVYTDHVNHSVISPEWVTLRTDKNVNPNFIPAYQWAVEKIYEESSTTSPVRITNREFPDVSISSLQLYVDGTVLFGSVVKPVAGVEGTSNGQYDFSDIKNTKGVYFQRVPAEQKKDKYLGYKRIDPETYNVYTYTFNYLHDLNMDKYLDVSNVYSDSLLFVSDNKTQFELKPYTRPVTNVQEQAYGFVTTNTRITDIARLVKTSYVIRVKDGTKLDNAYKNIVIDNEGRYSVSQYPHTYRGDSAVFLLKTFNSIKQEDGSWRHYYAFLDTTSYNPKYRIGNAVHKVGITDADIWANAEGQHEKRTSSFAIERYDDPLYRRIFHTISPSSDIQTAPDTVEFFERDEPLNTLYEDSHSVYSTDENTGLPKGPRFLGIKNRQASSQPTYDHNGNLIQFEYAMYVDTAFVNRPVNWPRHSVEDNITPKPQYLIAVGLTVVPPGTYCPIHGIDPQCGHGIKTEGMTRGRFLINATDSAVHWTRGVTTNATKRLRDDTYIWNTEWERMIFADAIHKEDTLFILTPEQLQEANDATLWEMVRHPSNAHNVIYLGNNQHKDVVWQFRLIDEKKDHNGDYVEDFLIESESTNRDTTGVVGPIIAPMNGGWIKIQNNVPVISRGAYEDAIKDAQKFNIRRTDKNPTSVEDTNVAGSVQVISGNGSVTIQNAANKMVTITNILGQTVAKQAITYDNQTINLPKGIVVVAVEGENAVKAVVK